MTIEFAKAFAQIAHDAIGQVRKYTGEPYWTHTQAVADIVAAHGGSSEAIQAAHLHDYREDVITELIKQGRFDTLNFLEGIYHSKFSHAVRDAVNHLTDVFTRERFPHLNRAQRKALEAERYKEVPDWIKTIKLADLRHNTDSITQSDPKFAKTYLKEKKHLLISLEGGHADLLVVNQAIVNQGLTD